MSELSQEAVQVLSYYGRVNEAVNDPRHPAVHPLIQAGLITQVGGFMGYPVYQITDNGRSVLAGLQTDPFT